MNVVVLENQPNKIPTKLKPGSRVLLAGSDLGCFVGFFTFIVADERGAILKLFLPLSVSFSSLSTPSLLLSIGGDAFRVRNLSAAEAICGRQTWFGDQITLMLKCSLLTDGLY